jgi:IS30 family transposase
MSSVSRRDFVASLLADQPIPSNPLTLKPEHHCPAPSPLSFWSPELISGRLRAVDPIDYVCHESIYQYICLKAPQLIALLPPKHAKRRTKCPYRSHAEHIENRVFIDQRHAAIHARKILGHWESYSMVNGDRQSALNVIVERVTRLAHLTQLCHKTARATQQAIVRRLSKHPTDLVMSITYENGARTVGNSRSTSR